MVSSDDDVLEFWLEEDEGPCNAEFGAGGESGNAVTTGFAVTYGGVWYSEGGAVLDVDS